MNRTLGITSWERPGSPQNWQCRAGRDQRCNWGTVWNVPANRTWRVLRATLFLLVTSLFPSESSIAEITTATCRMPCAAGTTADYQNPKGGSGTGLGEFRNVRVYPFGLDSESDKRALVVATATMEFGTGEKKGVVVSQVGLSIGEDKSSHVAVLGESHFIEGPGVFRVGDWARMAAGDCFRGVLICMQGPEPGDFKMWVVETGGVPRKLSVPSPLASSKWKNMDLIPLSGSIVGWADGLDGKAHVAGSLLSLGSRLDKRGDGVLVQHDGIAWSFVDVPKAPRVPVKAWRRRIYSDFRLGRAGSVCKVVGVWSEGSKEGGAFCFDWKSGYEPLDLHAPYPKEEYPDSYFGDIHIVPSYDNPIHNRSFDSFSVAVCAQAGYPGNGFGYSFWSAKEFENVAIGAFSTRDGLSTEVVSLTDSLELYGWGVAQMDSILLAGDTDARSAVGYVVVHSPLYGHISAIRSAPSGLRSGVAARLPSRTQFLGKYAVSIGNRKTGADALLAPNRFAGYWLPKPGPEPISLVMLDKMGIPTGVRTIPWSQLLPGEPIQVAGE